MKMQGVNKNKNKNFTYDMMMRQITSRQLPRMQDYFTLPKNMHVLFSGYGYCIVLHILFFCNIMLTKGFNILLLPLFFEHNSFSFPTILILILLNCYVVCNRIRSWIC